MGRVIQTLGRPQAIFIVGAALAATSALIWPQFALPLIVSATVVGVLGLLLVVDRVGHHHARIRDLERRPPPVGSAMRPLTRSERATGLAGPSPRSLAEARARIAAAEVIVVDGARVGPVVSGFDVATDGALVTVVVPCHNEEAFLGACLQSLRAQSMPDWLAIVIDDCSSDGSLGVAQAHADADHRIQVVRHGINAGLSAARNTGLRLANTPFVTFLDADDLLLADSLGARVESFLGITSADVAGVFCGVEQVPEEVRLEDFPPTLPGKGRPFHDFVTSEGRCPFNAHAPLLRTDLIRAFGGFDEGLRHGAEDWDLWARLMRHGYQFVNSGSTTALYRQKRGSMVRHMPGEHVAVGMELLDRANSRIDDLNHPRTVFPFTEAWSHYRAIAVRGQRLAHYAGLAALTGDATQLTSVLGHFEPGTWPVLRRHAEVEATLRSGIRRGLGLAEGATKVLGDQIDRLAARLTEMIHARTEHTAVASTAVEEPIDVLYVPQNAVVATKMVALAPEERGQVAFLDLSLVGGPQGVPEVVSRAGYELVSLNRWVLDGRRARSIAVSSPLDGTVAALMRAAEAEGAAATDIKAMPSETLLRENPGTSAPELDVDGGPSRASSDRSPSLITIDLARARDVRGSTASDRAAMERFRNAHRGERIFIIGNGPSLNDLDLRLLKNEVTLGVNGIFYARDRMGFDPSYYVVEDTSVMRENLEHIKAYAAGHKFFPSIYRRLVGEAPNVSYFTMNRGFYDRHSPYYCVPRFSTDAASELYCGQSVTVINLQLAYWMGFEEVVLIGMDFSYTIPDSAEREGDIITSTEDDPNHFHPDYFGKGKTWKDPKLDRVLANYALAKEMFEADGRRIVNATPGGRLELFERVDYETILGVNA